MTHTTHKPSFLLRLAALAGGLALASTLPAQSPSWFPLEVGNTWLYRPTASNRPISGDGQYRSILVHGKESIGGRDYFDVTYFGREVILRADPSNASVVLYDRESGAERPWLALGLPVGGTFPTEINPCPSSGEIASRNASVTVPAGSFTDTLQVRYQGSCADVGTTQQFYATDVGLVSNEETTFAGPIRYDLVYYRAGSGTGAGQETSFTVALDSPRYPAGATLKMRLTLRSTSPDPITLHFPSGQSFDLKIRNDKGEGFYTWSADKLFAMIVRDETFGPGEKTYGLTAPLTNLPPGRYIAEAYLTTDPLLYSGQIAFEVVPAAQIVARNFIPGVVKETRLNVSHK